MLNSIQTAQYIQCNIFKAESMYEVDWGVVEIWDAYEYKSCGVGMYDTWTYGVSRSLPHVTCAIAR